MNATTKTIIERLPKRPLLSPGDIAAAYGMPHTGIILDDIRSGLIAANRIGKKFYISHAEASRYIEANEVEATEGIIAK